jgi:hypothetical protein
MLEPILQQVGAGNPQLAQLIGQNQEQFLQLLSEDIDEEGGAQLPPGVQTISVTEEERDAIERVSLSSPFHMNRLLIIDLPRTPAVSPRVFTGFRYSGILCVR